MKKIILGFIILCASFSAKAQDMRMFSFADLSEKLLPTVVNISTVGNNEESSEEFLPENNGNISLGSGFFIDESGYIVTNNHVISGAEKILVTTANDKTYEAKVKGVDTKTDLALIKIEDSILFPYVKLGDSDIIRIGDWILAIGNPFGLGGSVTAGIISAKSRDIESGSYDNFIQTDASINQGNSGGPMFNIDGEVIGINTAIYSTSGGNMGIGFALPINLAKFVIEQLKTKGSVERGWLGIKVQAMTDDLAKSQGLNGSKGVLLSDISENSPAAKAGLEVGDILLSFNNKPILQARKFSQSVAETAPDTIVDIDFWRNKKHSKIKVKTEIMPIEDKKETQTNANITSGINGTYIAVLGVYVNEITPELLDKYNIIGKPKGVVVSLVDKNSDAEIKGIREGDIISQVDKFDIFSIDELQNWVMQAKKENNRPVLLTLNSNGIANFAAVKLKDKNHGKN